MRGLAIGRATGNVYSPFHAQPGCCLLLNSRNCCSGGWTTGVWGGGGFYRLQWTIPASTAIPGQLLRFDGALDNLPGSCCFSHESTDLIRPGMVPGTLCSSCNTQSKLCAQGGLRVSWGIREIFDHFYKHQNHSGFGLFYQKRLLGLQESSLAHRHRAHPWGREEPLLGPPATALPLNQLDAGAGPWEVCPFLNRKKESRDKAEFIDFLGSAFKA